MTNGAVVLQAFAILFREGLEALLIIAALAAFLRRAGAEARIGLLYLGAGLAILASLGLAWVFATFYDGNHSDLVEAAVMLAAAGLLFYMSGWLFLRQDPKAWQVELNRMAERALGVGTVVSLVGVAFLAVLREGAETVLFLHALAKSANGFDASLVGGLVAATLALAATFVAMQWLALRLPLRLLFLVTSAFLFAIGLKLVGEAIFEMQEQTLLPMHSEGVPAFIELLGLNPSWEALGAQVAIVLAAFLAGFRYWNRRRRPADGPIEVMG